PGGQGRVRGPARGYAGGQTNLLLAPLGGCDAPTGVGHRARRMGWEAMGRHRIMRVNHVGEHGTVPGSHMGHAKPRMEPCLGHHMVGWTESGPGSHWMPGLDGTGVGQAAGHPDRQGHEAKLFDNVHTDPLSEIGANEGCTLAIASSLLPSGTIRGGA